MQSNILDSEIHLGHRERMRRKLVTYGGEIFDTYELLEMLLYFVIPQKDTNPISKRLLATFGGLDGVLSSGCEDLAAVDGIGKAAAGYISFVGKLPEIISSQRPLKKSLNSYEAVGKYFVDHFKNKDEYTVSVLLLDNSMRPIKIVDLYHCDYGSGSVKSKPFLDAALENGASVAIIGHNHPFGPLYPAHADILTHKIIDEDFRHSGVELLDHYLISGNGYIRIGEMATKADGTDKLLREFGIVCVENDVCSFMDSEIFIGVSDAEGEYISGYLSYTISDEEKRNQTVKKLLDLYHGLDGVFSRSYDELSAVCGSRSAFSLKLLAYVTSRRFTDSVSKGKRYGEWMKDYFKWHFFGMSFEAVYIALFDKNEKLISVNKLSEGTVNASEIVPRKAMEAAVKVGAKHAVLAHNHPGGVSVSSRGDVLATEIIKQVLSNVGTQLLSHLIVAGEDVGIVSISAE